MQRSTCRVLSLSVLVVLSHAQTVTWKDTQVYTSDIDNGNTYQFGLAIGPHGQMYGVGKTDSALDLHPKRAASVGDAFLRKMNSDGVHEWTRFWSGPATDSQLVSVTTDPGGNIYACGSTTNSFYSSVNGVVSLLLVKMNPSGDLVFGRQFVDDFTIRPTNAAVRTCTLSYSAGTLSFSFMSYSGDSWRTARVSAVNGDFIWGVDINPSSSMTVGADGQPNSGMDADGNVLTGITFQGSVLPEESVQGVTNLFDGGSVWNAVVAKYEPQSGGLLWRTFLSAIGGNSNGLRHKSVASDAQGDVYSCGLLTNAARVDGLLNPNPSYHSGYVVKMSGADGAILWKQVYRLDGWAGHQYISACTVDWTAGHVWALATNYATDTQSRLLLLDTDNGDVIEETGPRGGSQQYARNLVQGPTGLLYESGYFYSSLEATFSGTKYVSDYHPYTRRFSLTNETENCGCDELGARVNTLGSILGLNFTGLLSAATA